jgi:outer membrane protein insertion porin family
MVATSEQRPYLPGVSRLGRLLLIALLIPFAGFTQSVNHQAYEGMRITDIVFEPVQQPYPLPELLNLLPLKVGGTFQQRQLPQAIQKLFSTGRFADVAVDGTDWNGGLRLKFITKRAYFVGQVSFTGVREPPNNGQLYSATKLQLGRAYVDTDKFRAIESLQTLLRRNGLYKASVKASTVFDDPTETVNMQFDIDAGERSHFEQPSISGSPERSIQGIVKATKWRHLFGFRGWHAFTDARLQQGLDNIREFYQKKDLLLAQVSLRQLEYDPAANTVRPLINIEGGPKVVIRTDGMRIGLGKLKQLVPIYQERSVDEDLLMEGQRNIAQYLQAQGYFEASVTHAQRDGKNNEKIITYDIERGDRHKLVKLAITGNRYFTQETIRERLYLTPAEFPRFPHGRYSAALLQKDIGAISDLYVTNGFRNVKVEDRVVDDYRGKTSQIAVFINIVEGKQTYVSKVDIQGPSAQDQHYLRSILLSSPGEPFSELNAATDRDAVLNYFYNNGYLNAQFEYYVEPTGQPDRVNLKFVVEPGPQKSVRQVLVGGLQITRPKVVFNRMELHPGDPLSFAKNTDTERRLYDLGIFARVDVALQNPDGQESSKYVLYELEEARRYSVNVGVGAEFGRIGGGYTLNAPAGAAGFSPRLTLGVSRLNFRGIGHTISFQSKLSNIEQEAALNYIVPQFVTREDLTLTLSALYDSSHDIRTFSAVRREASAQLGQRLSKANTLQYRLVFRRVTQGDLLIDPLLVPLLAQPVRVGLAGLSFIQDKRDDPADSHRGSYTTVDAGYAGRFLASQTEFTRLSVRNSTYYPISRDLVFARSTYFGWNARISGSRLIPLSERFFAGGATSQRAFPENQAGPRDLETGFPIGGNSVLTNNLELRFPLIGDNLGGVLFEDAGNVYNDIHDISFRFRQRNLQDFNYMVHAVGVGFRYHTPIGPVRVDLSFSPNSPRFVGYKGSLEDFLNPDTRGNLPRVTQRINQFQFHFSLGQAF